MGALVFLKLGGSLITDKRLAYTPRLDTLARLADEIASARRLLPALELVLGHGSGSFGHTEASRYGTRQGVRSSPGEYWHGFSEVWYQAAALNRHVMDALHAAGLDAISLSPAASILAEEGRIVHWDLEPLQRALAGRILPVVHGDVIFDRGRGGTILSTEGLFAHLARVLNPERILLAGLEAGVWADFPSRTRLLAHITPATYDAVRDGVGRSHGADVTGGMESKVREMLALARSVPGLQVQIFSGDEPGNVHRALTGAQVGTLLSGG